MNRRLRVLAGSMLGLGLLASCFSERVASTAGAQCVAPPDSTTLGSPIIRIVDFEFRPASACITPGTTVTWLNAGTQIHSATSDLGVWDSSFLSPNATYTRTFTAAGSFAYHCTPHPWMVGRVVVQ